MEVLLLDNECVEFVPTFYDCFLALCSLRPDRALKTIMVFDKHYRIVSQCPIKPQQKYALYLDTPIVCLSNFRIRELSWMGTQGITLSLKDGHPPSQLLVQKQDDGLPCSCYENTPVLYNRRIFGMATTLHNLVKLRVMVPQINKIKYALKVLNFHKLSNDVSKYIGTMLAELIRIDPSLYFD